MRAPLTFLLLSAVGCTTLATLCPQGIKYWNASLERCVNCTKCDLTVNQIVLRPCEVHRDTICGPFHELDIDWNWVNQHHRRHHGKHGHNRHRNGELQEEPGKHISTAEVIFKSLFLNLKYYFFVFFLGDS